MKAFLPNNFTLAPYAQLCSYLFLFSPIPLFLEVFRTKQLSKIPNLTYPALAMMQLGWAMYGYLISNSALVYTSVISLAAHTIYSTIAFIMKRKFINILGFYLILLFLTFIYRQLSSEVMGTLACVVQLMSSSTNWELIIKSVKIKSGDAFNIKSVLMSIPSGLLWAGYGLEIADLMIFLPPFYDTILFSLQLCIKIIWSGKGKKE